MTLFELQSEKSLCRIQLSFETPKREHRLGARASLVSSVDQNGFAAIALIAWSLATAYSFFVFASRTRK